MPIKEKGQNATQIANKGVSTTAPTNGQVLTYNSTSGDWAPATPASGSASFPGIDDSTSSNDDQLSISDSEICVNEDGDDLNFRVEGDTKTHLLFVDGGADMVGINTNAPGARLAIYDNLSAPTDLGNHGNYQFVIQGGGTTGQAAGILLASAGSTYGGSAIVHYDIGPGGKGDLAFYTKQAETAIPPVEVMRLGADGNVGIGTTDPDSLLEVAKASADAEVLISCYHNTEATTPKITFRKADNTEASPALVDDDAVLGTIDFLGHDGTNFERGAKIEARVQGTSANNDLPTELTFWTTPDGTNAAVERVSFGADGAVALKTLAAAPSAAADYAKIYATDTGPVASSNIKLLLHGTGTDGSTAIVDSSQGGHSPSANTAVEIDTAQYVGSGTMGSGLSFSGASSSILFNGSSSVLTYADSSDWDIAADSAFVIQAWVRFDGTPAAAVIVSGSSAAGGYRLLYYPDSGGTWQFGYGGSYAGNYVVADTGVAAATWHHVAVVRQTDGTTRIFRDGVQKGSDTSFTTALEPEGLLVGRNYATEYYFDGWIAELAIMTGTNNGWTGTSITPPTSPTEGTAEMNVIDENGNATKISPHRNGRWEFYSKNQKTGRVVRIDMESVVEDLGQLTGKNYIKDE